MSNLATLAFAIDLAWQRGRDGQELNDVAVEKIVERAKVLGTTPATAPVEEEAPPQPEAILHYRDIPCWSRADLEAAAGEPGHWSEFIREMARMAAVFELTGARTNNYRLMFEKMAATSATQAEDTTMFEGLFEKEKAERSRHF